MRKDIHPEYREVLFHDTSVDEYFLVRSTLQTDQTKEWTDGNTYPYCPLDVSSASHPFYTGKQKLVDTGGRVDRFRKRFGKKINVAASTEETAVEEEVMEVAADSEEVTEEAPEATNADKVSKEESSPEDN